METKEYYTPTVEELFTGYECQKRVKTELIKGLNGTESGYIDVELNNWKDFIITPEYWQGGFSESTGFADYELDLRTPYLCKQNIIDLGWEHKQYVKDSNLVYNFVKGEWYLEFWVGQTPYIEIGKEGYDTGFAGNCKSKNELVKLEKMLSIVI